MKLKHIGHAAFHMRDMEKALDFYCNGLGMEVQFSLNYGDLYEYASKLYPNADADPQIKARLDALAAMRDMPWLVYLRLSEGQFLELFYIYEERETLSDRDACYGYQKIGFEVNDLQAFRRKIVENGIPIDQDIAESADYSMEMVIHDSEGNKIHLIEYSETTLELLGEKPLPRASVKDKTQTLCITQMAFQIRHPEEMRRFYLEGLGMKVRRALTFKDVADYLRRLPAPTDENLLTQLDMLSSMVWIDFVEAAPHEYIEFFYTYGEEKKEIADTEAYYGYQHLCIEVDDIHEAKCYVEAHGITPETEISFGPDGAYQFWLRDPDGNKLELMQYSPKALQIRKD